MDENAMKCYNETFLYVSFVFCNKVLIFFYCSWLNFPRTIYVLHCLKVQSTPNKNHHVGRYRKKPGRKTSKMHEQVPYYEEPPNHLPRVFLLVLRLSVTCNPTNYHKSSRQHVAKCRLRRFCRIFPAISETAHQQTRLQIYTVPIYCDVHSIYGFKLLQGLSFAIIDIYPPRIRWSNFVVLSVHLHQRN